MFKNATHKEFGISHQQLRTGMKFSVQVTGKMLATVSGKVIEACGEKSCTSTPSELQLIDWHP